MNTKNNKRFKDTENKIIDTTLMLIKEKDISKITVSDICKKTKMNRSTFYAHFQDIPELMERIDSLMKKNLVNSFPSEDYKIIYKTGDFLKPFLTYVKENLYFYRAILKTRTTFPIKDGYNSLMDLVVSPICNEAGITSKTQIYYSLTFFQAGFTIVLKNWVLNDCKEPIDDIVKYLKICMHI